MDFAFNGFGSSAVISACGCSVSTASVDDTVAASVAGSVVCCSVCKVLLLVAVSLESVQPPASVSSIVKKIAVAIRFFIFSLHHLLIKCC